MKILYLELALWILLSGSARIATAGDIECLVFPRASIDDTADVWTPFRKDSAFPARMPVFSGTSDIETEVLPFNTLVHQFSRWTSASAMVATVLEASPVHDSDKRLPPFRSSGKLFFDDFAGRPDWCTATIVEGPTSPTSLGDPLLLLTAAHCVFAPGQGFFANLYFTRAFEPPNGGEDFSIAAVGLYKAWFDTGKADDRFDYAFLLTTTKRSIGSVAPLVFSTTTASDWIAVAYPDEIIDAGVPRTVGGSTMMHADGVGGPSPSAGLALMIQTPFGHGASGGGWIPPPETGATGQLISISSSLVAGSVNSLIGPIFDGKTTMLFEEVRDLCPTSE